MPKSKHRTKRISGKAAGRSYPHNCIGRSVNGRLVCLTHGDKCPWDKRINGSNEVPKSEINDAMKRAFERDLADGHLTR